MKTLVEKCDIHITTIKNALPQEKPVAGKFQISEDCTAAALVGGTEIQILNRSFSGFQYTAQRLPCMMRLLLPLPIITVAFSSSLNMATVQSSEIWNFPATGFSCGRAFLMVVMEMSTFSTNVFIVTERLEVQQQYGYRLKRIHSGIS